MPEVFPNFQLTDQVALVTGAGRGLGRAISLALANWGKSETNKADLARVGFVCFRIYASMMPQTSL